MIHADWVFGYGSLIWNPEIGYQRAELARLNGFHRAFCIRSTRYRGTPENPGVVLGLDQGGSCTGVAFQLHPQDRVAAIERLYAREMRNRVYDPTLVSLELDSGTIVEALTFVANKESNAFQRLNDTEVLRRLTGCCGERGPNVDYLFNTHHSLKERGVNDAMLARLVELLQASPNTVPSA